MTNIWPTNLCFNMFYYFIQAQMNSQGYCKILNKIIYFDCEI